MFSCCCVKEGWGSFSDVGVDVGGEIGSMGLDMRRYRQFIVLTVCFIDSATIPITNIVFRMES